MEWPCTSQHVTNPRSRLSSKYIKASDSMLTAGETASPAMEIASPVKDFCPRSENLKINRNYCVVLYFPTHTWCYNILFIAIHSPLSIYFLL